LGTEEEEEEEEEEGGRRGWLKAPLALPMVIRAAQKQGIEQEEEEELKKKS
jgi:hypothetical protein